MSRWLYICPSGHRVCKSFLRPVPKAIFCDDCQIFDRKVAVMAAVRKARPTDEVPL